MKQQRLINLKKRAEMLKRARLFFLKRSILEIDCPVLTNFAALDTHIDLFEVLLEKEKKGYLHSSPEYGLKRLLTEGFPDCYQLAHVFRKGEQGMRHNPEFMLVEWYRLNYSFTLFIQETIAFIQLFLGPLQVKEISYSQVFKQFLQIDPFKASNRDLLAILDLKQIDYYKEVEKEGRDAILNLLLSHLIEPHLGKKELVVLKEYPPSQAALAKVVKKGDNLVANRFEIYYQGVELANGYDELADGEELRTRFEIANQERIALNKKALPMDEFFLAALKKGLPPCCGVAVGFDRLMMLKLNCSHIKEVIPFTIENA